MPLLPKMVPTGEGTARGGGGSLVCPSSMFAVMQLCTNPLSWDLWLCDETEMVTGSRASLLAPTYFYAKTIPGIGEVPPRKALGALGLNSQCCSCWEVLHLMNLHLLLVIMLKTWMTKWWRQQQQQWRWGLWILCITPSFFDRLATGGESSLFGSGTQLKGEFILYGFLVFWYTKKTAQRCSKDQQGGGSKASSFVCRENMKSAACSLEGLPLGTVSVHSNEVVHFLLGEQFL